MPELSPRVAARFRTLIGHYHAETEELIRVLEALEAAGLRTYPLKQVRKVHYRLEKYLEALDAGRFDQASLGRLAQQFEDGLLPSYDRDEAFTSPSGRAISQMAKTASAWNALNNYLFGLDVDFDELAEVDDGPA